MDDQNRPTETTNNPPGAPELSKGVKPPSAPLVNDRLTGPVFRATPTDQSTASAETPPSAAAESPLAAATTDQPDVDEHQARIDYLKSLRQDGNRRQKSGKRRWLVGLVIAILLLAAGGAAAYMWLKQSNSGSKRPAATHAQQSKQPSQAPTPANETGSAAETKTFTSSTLALSIAYPGDWTPAELKDSATITSPVVTLTDANGQTTNGRMVLNIRARQDKPVEFTAGDVVAVLDSAKVDYTRPSATQRGSTYLSYLQYATTTTKGGMDGVYITGDYGYKYGQTVRLAEIAKVDPLLDVTFVSCTDTTCASTTQKALTVSATAWQTDTKNRPAVETMLKSLVLN